MLSRSGSSVFPSVLSHVCPRVACPGNCVNGNLYHIQVCGGHSIKFVHVISALWSYVLSRQHASLSKGKTPLWLRVEASNIALYTLCLQHVNRFVHYHILNLSSGFARSRWFSYSPCVTCREAAVQVCSVKVNSISMYGYTTHNIDHCPSLSSGNRPTNVC